MKNDKKPGRFKSAILNWLGVPIDLTTGEFFHEWYGKSSSGQVVTVEKALGLDTVWACVRLICESLSTLPLKIYRRLPDGSREVAINHPVYDLLCRKPNSEMTPSRFMLQNSASIELRGNAYIEKKYIGNRLVSLVPLLPQNMKVSRNEAGRLEYEYTEASSKRKIPEKNLMHIRGFGIDGICGLMPMRAGCNVFGNAMSVEESAGKFFENGLQTSGFLLSKTPLKDEQRERLRGYLREFEGSKNAGKTMILELDMSYQGVTLNPEAAQLLESRGWSVEEICRWFKVPPFMVGHMTKQSSWASSVEGMNLLFLTNTLRPKLVNIEQEINRCLLNNDPDYYAEFSVEGLLRADSQGRSAYYAAALRDGWMNRNEVRRLENLPPISGGELYTVQLNLTTLTRLESDDPLEKAKAMRELHNYLFPDLPFGQTPLAKPVQE